MKQLSKSVIAAFAIVAPLAATAQDARLNVATWAKSMQRHEELVVKAIQIKDIDELRRQAVELRTRSAEPSNWPNEDRWTFARIYCTTMAQELANFVDDKLKRTARGEVAADASFKAYRDAGPNCKKGLQKVM
ncbi:hypothetical protein SAMN05428997_1482 [Bosea sp. CRIB-10]|uniref:hypothetical protein n=1 Tax=Bosea sp. CRIB-10 TaxID=378404 RepID=UPI0008E95F46|nr:hypothetical protein [Bosea sp. CRIB-10]SFD73958.1 hypothetical protein SAMN05428997_1482 [Bosea sp. CRIB-10]